MKNNLLGRFDIIYGIAGAAILLQFGAMGSWKSFASGWLIALVNFELLCRPVTTVIAIAKGEQRSNLLLVLLAFSKLSLLGLVIVLLTQAGWLQPVPFALGLMALVISAFERGIREIIYARNARI